MKALITLYFTLLSTQLMAVKIQGKVESSPKCDPKTMMVWLSLDKNDYQERLLLMHTEVPVGGTFEFHVKPGKYQVRASDEKGCEDYKRISIIQKNEMISLKVGEKK